MQFRKRQFLSLTSVGAAAFIFGCGQEATAKAKYAVTYSDAEWKKRLSPAAYRVLRQEDTEAPIHQPARQGKAQGHVRLRGMQPATVFVSHQVRQRHRLAEFLPTAWQRR